MVWYSHLLIFTQTVVINMFKGFGIVNKAEVDVFLKLSCFFADPVGIGGLISLRSTGLSSLLQYHSPKASIPRRSAFFMIQLSHPYMTTGKTIDRPLLAK